MLSAYAIGIQSELVPPIRAETTFSGEVVESYSHVFLIVYFKGI